MTSNGDIRVAEAAFVSAVAEALVLQNAMLELRMQLQQVDQHAATANDAALRELGFDEATPFEDIMAAQERFLVAAIEKAGLDEDAPVIKAARQQIKNMREEYNEMVNAEASQFGFKGPVM